MTPFGQSFFEEFQGLLKEAKKQNKRTPPGPPNQLPQLGRLTIPEPEDPKALKEMKRIGGHILAGGGAGKFLSGWVPGDTPRRSRIGTSIGAGLGLAEYWRKRRARQQEKQATVVSPITQLKATQATGRFVKKTTSRMMSKPAVKNVVPRI